MAVHELGNDHLTVRVCGLGARLMSVLAPDREGHVAHVVLGHDDEESYRDDRSFLGAVVGRFGGRIPQGRFTLDGHQHQVPTNEPDAALHGGTGGFDLQPWQEAPADDGASVTFRHVSPNGDNGFPGELTATATYTVDGSDLRIDLVATTDRTTIVNLLGHAYFNLSGGCASVDDHLLQVNAGSYLPVGEGLLLTGAVKPVDAALDLREPRRVGALVRRRAPQLELACGLDHGFVLDGPAEGGLREAAVVRHPGSGRTLTVLTDQPALQVYSGNMLDGSARLRDGLAARQGDALCLEPHQHLGLPEQTAACVLHPGQEARSRTVLRFGVA